MLSEKIYELQALASRLEELFRPEELSILKELLKQSVVKVFKKQSVVKVFIRKLSKLLPYDKRRNYAKKNCWNRIRSRCW